MKIIDILNEIANGTLEKGFTFEYDMQEWIFDGKERNNRGDGIAEGMVRTC